MPTTKPQIVFWGSAAVVALISQTLRAGMADVTYNHQLAFSIAWPTWLVIPTVSLFLVLVVVWFYRHHPASIWSALAFGLTCGGGASNLYERLRYTGLVADYWNMGGLFTFNLADASIFVGLVGLLIYFLYVKT